MNRRTLTHPLEVSGVGPYSGQPCEVTLAPAPFGHGLVFQTPEEAITASGEALEGDDSLTLYGEASEVGSVETLLAACVLTGISDLRISVSGEELPNRPLADWIADLSSSTEGPPRILRPVQEPTFVSGDRGYAAFAPGEPCLAVRLDEGPGATGEGILPLDLDLLATELVAGRRVRFDLAEAHANQAWLGLGPHNCATSADALRQPDEGLRWHMQCALALLALTDLRGRLELVGPDLEPLGRLLTVD